jgi:hypothetical protein
VDLSPEDRELYERVETQGRQIISGYLQAGTLMQNYASVGELFSIVGLIRRNFLWHRQVLMPWLQAEA